MSYPAAFIASATTGYSRTLSAGSTSPPLARCCRHRACGAARPQHTRHERIQTTHVPVPALRRADVDHRDLHSGSLHPRPARLECFTLSARRSPHSTASPALHPSAPAREPLAWRREKPCHCTDQAQNFACIRISTTYASVISAEYADLIVTSRRTASLQIPIAPRRC